MFSLVTSSNDTSINSIQWHARLGHIGQERMARLTREDSLGQLLKVVLPTYEHCLIEKSIEKPFGKAKRASIHLPLILSDICGQMNVKTRRVASHFIISIDDYTRYDHVYLISHKSEALNFFRQCIKKVENQVDKSTKALRTDVSIYLSNLKCYVRKKESLGN